MPVFDLTGYATLISWLLAAWREMYIGNQVHY